MNEYENDRIDQDIEYLVEMGALTLYGMEGDEPIYHMVPEVLKIISPDLYNAMMEEIDETLLHLYEEGYVDIDYDEDLNALFSISEEGIKVAEDMINHGNS